MEMAYDLVNYFDNDLALLIMESLDVIDVIRAVAVSKSWSRFVIANGLCKKEFLKRFPHVTQIFCEKEGIRHFIRLSDDLTVDDADWADLERDHRIYSSLLQPLAKPMDRQTDCLSYPLAASSARGIAQNVLNILNPAVGDRLLWCSEGKADPEVPEHITYKLCSDMCIVTEVTIRLHEASSEPGNPTYSPKSVRFRFGYLRTLADLALRFCPVDNTFDYYNWTYTSPVFPMTQEAGLQRFRLPEPIVCVGGVVQIEMLGRAQMDPRDGLFYIRLGCVEIMGQSLYPAYVLDVLRNGELQLKFFPRVLNLLRNFRFDPRELGSLVLNLESMPNGGDREQDEEDFRLIEKFFQEVVCSTST